MLGLLLDRRGAAPLRLLAIGAHPDDIEIGCGGTLIRLLEDGAVGEACMVILSGTAERAAEAQASAAALLAGAAERRVIVRDFTDGFFPYQGKEVKCFFEELKADLSPDLIFTHQRHDLHQDHRLTCDLTWHTFRNHMILEYEVPKYDGDMGRPNLFVPLGDDVRGRKIAHLMTYFASQHVKHWFKEDLFSGLLRLRGMECNSPTSFAEAFYCRKAVLT
jgi:LmbE family N-acetylglucosaminyl deacetylase